MRMDEMTMTNRERFSALMNFQTVDRLPVIEWANWWNETTERWHVDGLPASCKSRHDIYQYFGVDRIETAWFKPYGTCPRGSGRHDRQAGILVHVKDYEEARSMMFPDDSPDPAQLEKQAAVQQEDVVTFLQLDGFFWCPREVFGVERHLFSFYDEPDVMKDLNSRLLEWNLRQIDRVRKVYQPEYIVFSEDMTYNNGSMLSKEQFDEFVKPCYQTIVAHLEDADIPIMVDSDGDIHELTAWFSEAGISGMHPMERQAGTDVNYLRKAFPKMRFLGNFDKTKMHLGEQELRNEFERLMPAAVQGGYAISCDHQTPPAVSCEDYKLYVQLFREYAEKASREMRTVSGA